MFETHSWLLKTGHADKTKLFKHIYAHRDEGLIEIRDTDISMVCGKALRAYAISSVTPVDDIPEHAVYMCDRCSTYAENIIWSTIKCP